MALVPILFLVLARVSGPNIGLGLNGRKAPTVHNTRIGPKAQHFWTHVLTHKIWALALLMYPPTYGQLTLERVAKIGRNEKYKLKVDKYRKEAIDYSIPNVSTHVAPVEMSDEVYSALIQSLIDDGDGVEAEFSMLKCLMII